MKSVIGFGGQEPVQSEAKPQVVTTSGQPVRSLVSIRFADVEKSYTYYNDRFDLSVGDRVYVSGKMAGRMGMVASVNTRFKIKLSDYEKVVANPHIVFRGDYEQVLDKMVAYHGEVSAALFRSWVMPPQQEEDEIVMGDGYTLSLNHLRDCDDVEPAVLKRALTYCEEGRVRYLSLENGVGTAFVEGSKWYEVNFRYDGGEVTDVYCDCPYPGLCKHSLAVVLTLQVLLDHVREENFAAVDRGFFFGTIVSAGQSVTLR